MGAWAACCGEPAADGGAGDVKPTASDAQWSGHNFTARKVEYNAHEHFVKGNKQAPAAPSVTPGGRCAGKGGEVMDYG